MNQLNGQADPFFYNFKESTQKMHIQKNAIKYPYAPSSGRIPF